MTPTTLFLTFTQQDTDKIVTGDFSTRIEPPDVFETVEEAVKAASDYDSDTVVVWRVVGAPTKLLKLKQTIVEDL